MSNVCFASVLDRFNERHAHISSTLRTIGRTVIAAFKAHSPKQKSCRFLPPRQNWTERRRPILGDRNVSLVCSACGRAGLTCGCYCRYGFAAMKAGDNDGLLRGPADPKYIDIRSPAEMRHWAREIGQSAAKLNEAVRAVGPLVSNVRDYLRKHSLYGRPR